MIKILKKKKVIAAVSIYVVFVVLIFYMDSGSPPEDGITIYKGIYSSIFPTKMTKDAMREDGMNIVSIAVSYPVDSNGNIYTIPFIEKVKIAEIQSAHRKGLRVFLVVEPLAFGDPGGPTLPQNVKNNPELLERFIKQYNPLVLKWAEIAERYGVELFTPLNEFDYSLGSVERASDWGQEMLPKIKDIYSGKIVWKGALNYGYVEEFNINFTGYDYIGLTILIRDNDFDSLRNNTRGLIKTVCDFAKKDGVKGVMITEFGFGVEEKYLSEEEYAMGYQIILEEGRDKVVGFFVVDPPEFLGGPPLRSSIMEQTIREWYKERLP